MNTLECPECSMTVTSEPDCPGYEKDGQIRVCWPSEHCGNAVRFTCGECGWWWRDPNLRQARPMGKAPDWDPTPYLLDLLHPHRTLEGTQPWVPDE